MSIFDDIKIVAFRDVTKNTPEYRLNYIYRWYSKTYHTALHTVYSLPLHDIVKAFFEEKFESMSEEEIEDMRRELLMTEDERSESKVVEAKEEDDLDKLMETAAKKQDQKKTETIQISPQRELVNLPTISEKDLESLPENIKIEFVDEKFFDDIDKDDDISLFGKK